MDFLVLDTVVTLRLFTLCRLRDYGDRRPCLPARIFCTLVKVKGAFRKGSSTVFWRVVMVRLQYALGPLCVNFNYETPCEFMRHFAYFTGVAVEFGRFRSGTYRAPRMYTLTRGRRRVLVALVIAW